MFNFIKPENNEERLAKIPGELGILPLRNFVAYPFMMLPISAVTPKSVKLIEDA